MQEDLYLTLRSEVISGALMPNERLIEADIAERAGCSRAKVREALARLERDGLVVHESNRGARVRMVSIQEALEVVRVRQALEAMVAADAAINATDEDRARLVGILADMRETIDAGRTNQYRKLNRLLHQELSVISQNSTAGEVNREMRAKMARFQNSTFLVGERVEHSFAEHADIVDAIIAGDADSAASLMSLHLEHVRQILAAMLVD